MQDLIDTIDEQQEYINILEKENSALRQELSIVYGQVGGLRNSIRMQQKELDDVCKERDQLKVQKPKSSYECASPLLQCVHEKLVKEVELGQTNPWYSEDARMLWTIRSILSSKVFRVDRSQLIAPCPRSIVDWKEKYRKDMGFCEQVISDINTDKGELLKLFQHCPPQVFSDQDKYKMRDDLALKLFSKKSIDILLEQPPTATNIKAIIFFLRIYHLELLFTKLHPKQFQEIYIMSLFLGIKMYHEGFDFKRNSKGSGDDLVVIDYNNKKGTDVLTALDNEWQLQDMVHCAKVLDIIKSGNPISLYALDTLVCEHWFARIRLHSQNDNSIDRAKQVILDQLVLDYLSTKVDMDLEPHRVSEHSTSDIQIKKQLTVNEQREIYRITDLMMDLLRFKYLSDEDVPEPELKKFAEIVKWWKKVTYYEIQERYWKKIDTVVAQQPDYHSNNDGQTIPGRLFGQDKIDVGYHPKKESDGEGSNE